MSKKKKMENTLEQRIQKLEDLEAIRTLQATYGHYVDKGWNGKDMDIEKLTDIFTEDALWEAPAAGVLANGHKEIIESFKSFDEKNKFFIHSFTNPIIEINEDKATAKWILFSPAIDGEKVICMLASYDNDYVRTTNGWRIKSLRLNMANVLGA